MNATAQRVASLIWRYRFALAALCLLLNVLAAHELRTLGVSNSLGDWYPEDDAELVHYREFLERYGNDEIVIAAVTAAAGFDGETGRERIGRMTDDLLDIEGVASVTSVATVPQSLGRLRGRLLSSDGHTTAVLVQLMTGREVEQARPGILRTIDHTLSRHGDRVYLAGYGVVFDGLNDASTNGSATLLILAHGIMVVMLALVFGRPGPVLLTLVAVGSATLWTMGLFAAFGYQLNMITMVLPTLVMVIAVADCVHILRSVSRQSGGRAERVQRGLAEVIGPCSLTSVTTAAGFLALAVSGLPAVRALGLFGAIGMCMALFAAVAICTAGLSLELAEPRIRPSRSDRAARSLARFASARPWPVTVAFGVFTLAALAGMTQLVADTDSLGYLDESHRVRRDSAFIESTLGPYLPVDFTVTAEGRVTDEAVLVAVRRWQDAGRALPGIGWSWSLVDALGGGSPDHALDQADIDRRLRTLDGFAPRTVAGMLDGERQLRVSFGTSPASAAEMRELNASLLELAAAETILKVRAAGYSPLYARIVDELVWSQVYGFMAAVALILLLLAGGMRSWRRAGLALPANVLPVLATLGLMGFAGIPLDIASATIATVILGLVVDDSIHLLRPVREQAIGQGLRRSVGRSGGSLLITSAVLVAGFLVLACADIRSVAWFGILASFALTTAIAVDMLLLPALLALPGVSGLREGDSKTLIMLEKRSPHPSSGKHP